MATSHLSILTFVSVICLCLSSSCSHTTFTLSLTQHITVPSQDHVQEQTNQHPLMLRTINYLVSSSQARAHRLKNASASISQLPLFAHQSGDGYHSVFLSFGSPSQKLSYFMDTGSSLVWFPCTHRYTCSDCPVNNHTKLSVFMPELSSSAKVLKCNNKMCEWVIGPTDPTQCTGKQNCSYELEYGVGSTSGLLLSETLHFPEGDISGFAVGCSTLSTVPPLGVVGFGRGLESLPVQMGLTKFSYCLVSHKFDDKPVSSELLLFRESSNSGAGDEGMSYTKFRKNPSQYPEYYYLNLMKITVGGKNVKIPYRFLVPGPDYGDGGTIIDSGATFTLMDDHIYKLVEKEFEDQISEYKRATDVESQSGLRPCYKVGGKPAEFPELIFHFEGGANLSLPMADYFSTQEGEGEPPHSVSCMTIVLSKYYGLESTLGPSIVIGNYQQQDIYFEYDLENERLGFKKKICN